MTSLCETAGESLSKHKGELNLSGLTELSEPLAESLSKHKGNLLDLSGLSELSNTIAESLSKHKGELNLSGLTELSEPLADSLSKHKGNLLDLSGLSELSNATAESLSKHKGTLLLRGLNKPSDTVLQFLLGHNGWLSFQGNRGGPRAITQDEFIQSRVFYCNVNDTLVHSDYFICIDYSSGILERSHAEFPYRHDKVLLSDLSKPTIKQFNDYFIQKIPDEDIYCDDFAFLE